MTCNCKTEIEAELADMFRVKHPTAQHHRVDLIGYGLTVTPSGATQERPFMPAMAAAMFPTKAGGARPKQVKQNMFFAYCPFCGTKVGLPAVNTTPSQGTPA